MDLIILGAGGYGKTIADVASQLSIYERIMFLDDNSTENNVIGKLCDYKKYISSDIEFYPALGNNELRYKWFIELADNNANIATIIHPTSYISPSAVIGKGCAILPHAIINTNSVLCYACIVNIGAIVDHDNVLGVGVHVAPGAIIKGENVLPAFEKIESGSVIQTRQYAKDN